VFGKLDERGQVLEAKAGIRCHCLHENLRVGHRRRTFPRTLVPRNQPQPPIPENCGRRAALCRANSFRSTLPDRWQLLGSRSL
jgi:hypothetical protein